MAKRASARGIRRDVSGILRAPRRMLVADAVAGIYNRSKYIPQKQEALDRWVDYLDGLVGEENTIKVIKKRSA
ncbi:hypothetical protein [Klebsiella variicola]|uniref:hypothetical protein n=1 Tax=Klebsiella variicola TaxID=244366 RepID=UPI002181B385|nr:hypothetical protein [Klebsiella variicola]GKI75783.1 hypothetical protein NUKP6_55300 [Klebsiella variicola]